MTKNLIILALIICSTKLWAANSDYTPYVIKKGDIVSQLLVDNELTPLYGSKQWVEKVLKMNRLTQESARALEPGDVIVLPKESYVFKTAEYQDSISSVAAATERRVVKKIKKQYLAEKKHNITTTAQAFVQNYNFGGDNFVNIDQNFKFTVEYKRKNLKADNVAINPIIAVSTITQSQANFNERDTLSADFTPSYQLDTGAEFYFSKYDVALTTLARAEQFSRLYFEDEEYNVDTENNTWALVQVRKDFKNKKNTYYIGSDFAQASELDGQIIGGFIGVDFMKHYQLVLRTESSSFTLGEEATQRAQSLSLGYKW